MKYLRRVIRIRAEDSPNVQAKADVLTGVLTYSEYLQRRATWDKVRQCIGLDADFFEGAELLLFPPEWLNRAERVAESLREKRWRKALGIGIDPAEGGDRTAMSAVDEWGLIEQVSRKTPDTNVVVGEVIAFANKHSCPFERVTFDRGGGGKEHADRMRAMGYNVKTVAFGESPTLDMRRGKNRLADRQDNREDRYAFLNRRAEMYWDLSGLLDPAREQAINGDRGSHAFGIPVEYAELRRQLSVLPKLYDGEGRIYLPPKNKKSETQKVKTLTEMLGCSPDEADSLVLAVHAMLKVHKRSTAGAF